jgi:hypothetical protein
MAGSIDLTVTNNNLPLLSQLDPLMRMSLKRVMSEFGAELEATAVKAIQGQMPPNQAPWPELSEWWKEWKKSKGFSEQIYIMSSSYVQAITWKVKETADDIQTIAGVMRDAGDTVDGGQPIWYVAEILEYGWEEFNVRIPPRPLWRPTLELHRHSFQTRIGTAIYWATQKIAAQAKGNVI